MSSVIERGFASPGDAFLAVALTWREYGAQARRAVAGLAAEETR